MLASISSAAVDSGIRQDGRADPGSCRYSGLRPWLLRGCCIKPPATCRSALEEVRQEGCSV